MAESVARMNGELNQVAEEAVVARLHYKQMGVPIVVWQDGHVVEIPPEEIVVDLPPAGSPPANPS